MKIKTKLYLSILVSATLIALFLLTRIILFNSIGQESSRVKIAAEVKTAVFDLNILLNDYLFNKTERAVKQWELRYTSGLAVLQKAEAEESERVLISSLANDYLLFSTSFKQAVENYNYKQKLIKDEASPQELAQLENQDARIISQLSIQSQSIISSANILEKRALARLDGIYALTRNSAYGLTILILIITAAVSIKISKDIAKSLTKLRKGTEIIGAGDLEHRIDIKSKDEIGQVAGAFNEMAGKLKESYSGLEKKVMDRTQSLEDAKIAARNVLEDLQAEKEKLAEAKAKDEALLESIGEGVVATDKEGQVILVNKVAENLFGFTSAEMLGKIFINVISIQDEEGNLIPDKLRPITLTLNSGKSTTTTTTYYFTKKDKTRLPIVVTATPIILNGEVIGVIGIYRDITKEKEIDKAKTEFVSLASHQLRTPLSAMKWFCEMLLNGDAGQLSPEQKEYTQNISDSNERIIALVNSLLNISRIEEGRLGVQPEPTDIKNLVFEVLEEVKQDADGKKQQVNVFINQNLPLINVDPKLIKEVYINLFSNAIKYTPLGGKISVMVSASPSQLISRVSDSGIGIPKSQQGRVFEKFFRADNAVKLQTEGTGLGLYLAKAIIQSSGGKIWFESEENQGTSFIFSLPLTGSAAKIGEVTLNNL